MSVSKRMSVGLLAVAALTLTGCSESVDPPLKEVALSAFADYEDLTEAGLEPPERLEDLSARTLTLAKETDVEMAFFPIENGFCVEVSKEGKVHHADAPEHKEGVFDSFFRDDDDGLEPILGPCNEAFKKSGSFKLDGRVFVRQISEEN